MIAGQSVAAAAVLQQKCVRAVAAAALVAGVVTAHVTAEEAAAVATGAHWDAHVIAAAAAAVALLLVAGEQQGFAIEQQSGAVDLQRALSCLAALHLVKWDPAGGPHRLSVGVAAAQLGVSVSEWMKAGMVAARLRHGGVGGKTGVGRGVPGPEGAWQGDGLAV